MTLRTGVDLRDRIDQGTALRVRAIHDIGIHYPRTLRLWRERFVDEWSRLRALGYPEPLLRMWKYYFSYCEGGFLERTIGDVQVVLEKPYR